MTATDAYVELTNTLPSLSLSPRGHLVVAACLGVIGTLGFLCNLVVLALFCRYRALRTPMNLLLVSISASDLLVSVLGTPFSFAASTQGRWLIGRAGCVWYGFINACLGELPFRRHLRASVFSVWMRPNPDLNIPFHRSERSFRQ